MADIIIKGMEMPTSCGLCPMFCDDFNDYCSAAQRSIPFDAEKPEWCPLVPLPEGHGRLGDLDVLSKEFEHLASLDWNQKAAPYSWAYAYSEAQASVDDSPTIIEADLEWKMKNCCCFSNTDQAEGGGEDG